MESKNPEIFIICGKARSGKDTTSSFIKEIKEQENLKVLNLQYSSYIKEYAKKISDWDGSDETKPRALLQELGTEIIRNKIDEEFFIKKLIDDIKVYSFFFDVITISDARFKIEVDIPKQTFKNVYAIQITRPNFDNGLTEEQRNHRTEVDLDDYDKYDYKIINEGTKEELKEKIESILKEVHHES